MHAIVVYESAWGNTAAIARAIAEGIGEGARACTTDEAAPEVIAEADLIVAGAPVYAFGLPTEQMRENVRNGQSSASPAPDLSHPSLRSWLDVLPPGRGRSAAFETRLWWSPRGATGTIEQRLSARGYTPVAKVKKFVVLPRPFSVAGDELTVSLKMRRGVIFEKHRAELDALYRE